MSKRNRIKSPGGRRKRPHYTGDIRVDGAPVHHIPVKLTRWDDSLRKEHNESVEANNHTQQPN